jgi:hypothetical protein
MPNDHGFFIIKKLKSLRERNDSFVTHMLAKNTNVGGIHGSLTNAMELHQLFPIYYKSLNSIFDQVYINILINPSMY